MTEQSPCAEWSFGRLFQLKKDVHDLQNAFENIVKFGYSTEEIAALLSSDQVPQELKELADHPLVKVGGEIKSNLPSLSGFIKFTNSTLPQYVQDSIDQELVKASDRSKLLEFNKITRIKINDEARNSADTPELPKLTDESILVSIFTHKSAISEPAFNVTESNEKLIIIGKAVFEELLVTEIHKTFDNLTVEAFSKLKNLVVKPKTFVRWADLYDFPEYTIHKLDLEKGVATLIHGEVLLAYIGGLYVDSNCTHNKLTHWIHLLLQNVFDTIDMAALLEDKTQTPQISTVKVEKNDSEQTLSTTPAAYIGQNGSTRFPQPLIQPEPYQQPESILTAPSVNVPGMAHAVKFSKDTLYRKVCLSFVPDYTILSGTGAQGAYFKCACIINGEVIGVGISSTAKTAGSHAAFNALTYNHAAVEKYSNLAKAVKSKAISPPAKYELSVEAQVGRFPPDGRGPLVDEDFY